MTRSSRPLPKICGKCAKKLDVAYDYVLKLSATVSFLNIHVIPRNTAATKDKVLIDFLTWKVIDNSENCSRLMHCYNGSLNR